MGKRIKICGKGEYSDYEGTHINGVEGFWGYLKRYLVAKGGIRSERLPLYIAEFVWKYNHRNAPKNKQINRILKILNNQAVKSVLVASLVLYPNQ